MGKQATLHIQKMNMYIVYDQFTKMYILYHKNYAIMVWIHVHVHVAEILLNMMLYHTFKVKTHKHYKQNIIIM